jgi:hypothetical protein
VRYLLRRLQVSTQRRKGAKAQRRKGAKMQGKKVSLAGWLRSLFCEPDGSGFIRFASLRLCVFALISSPPAE